MKQVKIFKGLEYDYEGLQDEVNRWIRNEGVDVYDIQLRVAPQSPGEQASSVLGSGTPSDVFLMVVYEEA